MSWYAAVLWMWALWSVGAAAEFFLRLPLSLPALAFGIIAAAAMTLGRRTSSHVAAAVEPRTLRSVRKATIDA